MDVYKADIKEPIEDMYKESKCTPHCLIELSNKDLEKMRCNSIHLSGMKLNQEGKAMHITYENIQKGKYINLQKKKDKSSNIIKLEIEKTKHQYVVITASKEECIRMIPETICLNFSKNHHSLHKEGDNRCKLSGIVIIFFGIMKRKGDTTEKEIIWGNNHFQFLKNTKPNILASSKSAHFGSVGKYYSFGNKGSYAKVDNTTVSTYKTKKKENSGVQKYTDEIANMLEESCGTELVNAAKTIERYIPCIKHLISPVVTTAYELQNVYGNINISEVYTSPHGMWQSQICVNAKTSVLHTERDCTYTLITVPKQEISSAIKPCFLLYLNNNKTFKLSLQEDIVFMFSGAFLTHRQDYNDNDKTDRCLFFNMASYGNKRLFSHIRKSFHRN